MLIFTYTDFQWIRVSPRSCEAKCAHHHNTWKAHAARIKANGGARLRDVSALLNQCIDPNAYWFCTKTYRSYIQASLGDDPDIRLVARRPLFSLLNAPKLDLDSRPLFADMPIHQAYIASDWLQREKQERRLLICATSRTHTLSMPLQVFHAYALKHFNAVVYLFDTDRNHYLSCLRPTVECVRSLVESLQPGALGFVGTSAGACMAIHLCNQHENSKALTGSPVLSKFPELNNHLKSEMISDLHSYLRITYGDNPIDNRHKDCFERLSNDNLKPIAYNMSYISPTHASLGVTTLNGMFKELLAWLSIPRDADSRMQ